VYCENWWKRSFIEVIEGTIRRCNFTIFNELGGHKIQILKLKETFIYTGKIKLNSRKTIHPTGQNS
jgi:hypothetical protein